jgi:hypothetical protein
MRKSSWFPFALVSILSLTAASADERRIRPMIEIGGGTEAAWNQGFNVLLRVGFGLRQRPADRREGEVHGPQQLIWAHINGDFAFSPEGDGGGLPYMDVRIIPYHNSISVVSDPELSVMGELKLLPTQLGRDIRLDQDFTLRVSVVGVEFGAVNMRSEKVALVAQVAADVVGLRLATHVSELGRFLGASIANIGAEGGVAFPGLFPSEDSILRIVLGGTADIALGGNRGDGFALQSDMRAYLAIKADINNFIQVFLRGGINAACNTGQQCWSSPELMAGATVLF